MKFALLIFLSLASQAGALSVPIATPEVGGFKALKLGIIYCLAISKGTAKAGERFMLLRVATDNATGAKTYYGHAWGNGELITIKDSEINSILMACQ